MTTPAQPATGANNGVILPGPGPGAQAAARVRAARAETRAALLSGNLEPAAAAEDKPAVEPDAAHVEPVVEPAKDPAPDAAAEAKPDPETARRLATVQAAEKRAREKLDADRKALDAERAAHAKERADFAAQQAELAKYKKAADRAKVDPAAALKALGVEDLEYAARQAYAAAKVDPNNKALAADALRLREQADEMTELRESNKKLAERLDAREQREEQERQATAGRAALEQFLGTVHAEAAKGSSPLAKHFMAKNPAGTKARLEQVGAQLFNETGDPPDVADILARFEKTRREELIADGFDPDALVKAGAAPKKNEQDQAAGKKLPAPTLGNDLSTPRVPRRSSEREGRAETRGLIEAGKLDS